MGVLVFEGKSAENHPIESDPKRINVTFVSVPLLKPDLRRSGEEGSIVFLIKLLSFLKDLLAESKIRNFKDPIMNKYIFRLYIAMDDVKFVQIFESVENLLEVNKHILLLLELLLIVKIGEVAVEIFIVAVLENKIDAIVARIADNVDDLDDVDVVAKFDERFDLLTREGDDLIDFADLVDAARNVNHLQRQLVDLLLLLVLVEADVDLPVGTLPQHKLRTFGIVIDEGFVSVLRVLREELLVVGAFHHVGELLALTGLVGEIQHEVELYLRGLFIHPSLVIIIAIAAETHP